MNTSRKVVDVFRGVQVSVATSLADGRDGVDDVAGWYNIEHKHSKLNMVTPAERHAQQDGEILAKRQQVLENAKEAKPNRWSQSVRNCQPIGVEILNPDKIENIEMKAMG
jgi:transposase InsO family protein